MFATPVTITVNAIAKSLERTGTGIDQGAYSTADRSYRLSVSHNYGRRTRRVIKLIHDSLVANPLVSGQNVNQTVQIHTVIDTPPGYDTTLLKQDVDGYLAALTASSGALVAKLIAGES